jgi:DNA repair exonuclease SbcCD nuclease subunit
VRFLHTSDWQLGITRAFLGTEAQAQWSADRLEAVRGLLALAGEQACAAVVVAGDVFEHHLVPAGVVAQTLDALASSPVPVVLLPGNHDPLDPASIYRERASAEKLPPPVQVATDPGVLEPVPGLELVCAPYPARRPPHDLLQQALAGLGPAPRGVTRVLLAHGQVTSYGGEAATIDRAVVDAALAEGVVHYAALGDHHSRRQVDEAGRIWYSGTVEVTAFDERDPGWVLVVDVDPAGEVAVQPHRVGRWQFVEERVELGGADDVAQLAADLSGRADRHRTVLRLRLTGGLGLADRVALDRLFDDADPDALVHHFAAVEVDDRELVVVPDALDADTLGLAGFAADAAAELRELATGDGEEALRARDALALLYRLVRSDRGGR